MCTISQLKEDKPYMAFLSELPTVQQLKAEHKALQKEIQKKRRKLHTQIHKYQFLNDIVSVGGTDTPLSLAIKRALKEVGFTNVHHLDKQKREDIRLTHDNTIVLFEITGITGGAKRGKGFQIIVNTMVARKNSTERVHGCLLINHNNDKHFQKRNPKPFQDKDMNIDVDAGEVSLLTTVTLRLMLMDIIKGMLMPEEFIKLLCVVGEVKYNRA